MKFTLVVLNTGGDIMATVCYYILHGYCTEEGKGLILPAKLLPRSVIRMWGLHFSAITRHHCKFQRAEKCWWFFGETLVSLLTDRQQQIQVKYVTEVFLQYLL